MAGQSTAARRSPLRSPYPSDRPTAGSNKRVVTGVVADLQREVGLDVLGFVVDVLYVRAQHLAEHDDE